MTAASSTPFPQGRSPSFDKFATHLSHYTPLLWVLAVPAFTSPRFLDGIGPWATLFVSVIPTALLLGTAITVDIWHVYALCDICARKTPLDPAAAVRKHDRALRMIHWLGERHGKATKRTLYTLMALLFVPYVGVVAFPLLMLCHGFFGSLELRHRPLQPWCPYCRWNDGGDEEPSPEPTPDPENVATV